MDSLKKLKVPTLFMGSPWPTPSLPPFILCYVFFLSLSPTSFFPRPKMCVYCVLYGNILWLILCSCGDPNLFIFCFVMGIFDWPITKNLIKFSKDPKYMCSHFLDLGCLYRLQEYNLRQKLWG